MEFGRMNTRPKRQPLSPLDKFWNEQSQKLNANDGFRDDLGSLFDDELTFRTTRLNTEANTLLDFSVFDLQHIKLEKVATLTLGDQSFELTLKEYVKLAVICSITDKSVRYARAAYSMMMHIAAFLNEQGVNSLDADNLEAFHIFFLTQTVSNKGLSTRLSAPACRESYGNAALHRMKDDLRSIGVQGMISPQISRNRVESSLDNVCRSVMGMSRLEYAKGGSFNALTLDMGQYYVDHLKRVYEEGYLYTLLCRSVIRDVTAENEFPRNSSPLLNFLTDTIRGSFKPSASTPSKNKLKKELRARLYKKYQEHHEKVLSLKEDNICEVVRQLGLDMRFDAVEIIRVLMLQKFYSFSACKTADDIWQGYLMSLKKTETQTTYARYSRAKDVYSLMSKVLTPQRLDKDAFLSSLSTWSKDLVDGTYVDFKHQLSRICRAMTTLVVAYLGYRESEFGFPLSAIQAHPNLDVLDNSHVPFRFKVKWLVPKTNKTVKIEREITSQCYQLAAQLNDVFQPGNNEPCLYEDFRADRSAEPASEKYIPRTVMANWEHFVKRYQPFVDIRELQRLSEVSDKERTDAQKASLSSLHSKYDLSSARVQNLLQASEEVIRDLPKIMCTTVYNPRANKKFKKSLEEYQKTGDIKDPLHRHVVKNFLSPETQQWLLSGEGVLDQKSMLDIGREFMQDVRYPIPHALRHIWAEAVLLRYQGDVGAVIRHQFCHLDDSFFMAYLRDKENKGLMQAARINVINTLVSTLMRDTEHAGHGYLGGFSRFVKKAVSLTHAITPNDVRLLKDRITGRVISLQPSRFAMCVPREGSEARAKCADMGDINPQNARPEFCLGCIHSVITSGNIQGIWATVQPFVKDCLNEEVMGFMVQSHLPTLRSAYKRINELSPNANDSVNKVLAFIQKAIANVENKLKEEQALYA